MQVSLQCIFNSAFGPWPFLMLQSWLVSLPTANTHNTWSSFVLFLQAAMSHGLHCSHSRVPTISESVQIPPATRKSNFMDMAKFVWCVGGLIHEDHCLLSAVIQALLLQEREAGTQIFFTSWGQATSVAVGCRSSVEDCAWPKVNTTITVLHGIGKRS